MTLPNVVIVGGGPGGLSTARALHGAANVTLVEAKGFHEINWGSLRALTDPGFVDRVIVDYDAVPNIGTLVQARATGFDSSSVSLDNGQTLSFDYLVLAVGSSYPSPAIKPGAGSLADRRAAFQADHQRLQDASSVLIIGGGPVGVELASEIAVDLPGKKVTLVTAADRLVADKRVKVGARSQAFLESHGVVVVTGQKAAQQPDGSYLLGDGRKLEADLVFVTVGLTPNTAFLKGSPVLTDKGFVKVNSSLQVEGFDNVFAVGDAADVAETKMGFYATLHAAVVAANVKTLAAARESGAASPRLKAYSPYGGLPEMMAVSLGRNAAIMQVGWFAFGGYIPWKVKGQDLTTGKTWNALGMTPPALA